MRNRGLLLLMAVLAVACSSTSKATSDEMADDAVETTATRTAPAETTAVEPTLSVTSWDLTAGSDGGGLSDAIGARDWDALSAISPELSDYLSSDESIIEFRLTPTVAAPVVTLSGVVEGWLAYEVRDDGTAAPVTLVYCATFKWAYDDTLDVLAMEFMQQRPGAPGNFVEMGYDPEAPLCVLTGFVPSTTGNDLLVDDEEATLLTTYANRWAPSLPVSSAGVLQEWMMQACSQLAGATDAETAYQGVIDSNILDGAEDASETLTMMVASAYAGCEQTATAVLGALAPVWVTEG